jgi:hypothetical protein
MTHTYGKRLNANFTLVPLWFTLENPPSKRVILIYETNYNVSWVQTLSLPST